MIRAFWVCAGLTVFFACSSTVPQTPPVPQQPVTVPPAEPSDFAVLPFENRTGNPNLNWLRTALSAAMSGRLKERRGLTTVDGAFVSQVMEEQRLLPVMMLTKEQAIGLSGSLFASSLITGAFEGQEKELILSGSVISGESGEVVKSAATPVRFNDRSRAINNLIDALMGDGAPELEAADRADQLDASDAPRTRIRAARPPVETTMEGFKALSFDTPEEVERAIKAYRQTIETNPEFADAHFAIGYGYDRQGDTEKALAAYRQAVTLNPLNADYRYTLGYAYERSKDYRQAIEHYRAALAITPDDAEIAFALAYAHEQIGEYAQAIEAYRQAIALNPVDYDAHRGLASAFESGGQLNQALEQYRRLLELHPADLTLAKTFTAIAVKVQRWDEVAGVCQSIIERNPGDIETREILAQAYRSQGNTALAMATYQDIIRLDPGHSAAYTSLGNLYVRQKQYDRAVAQYRAGIKAVPTASLLYLNLGHVLAAQKDYRGALEAYDAYLKTDPQGEYADQIRKKIEEVRFRIMKEQ